MSTPEEALIAWSGFLTPMEPMPFGIICTVTPSVKDQHGTIRQKLTIRLPIWDENDLVLYKAKLTASGNGIILSMPSVPSFMRKLEHIPDLNRGWRIFEEQTVDLHVAFCNKMDQAKEGAVPLTIKVLLRFPEGDTYNNKSFNNVRANDDFGLEQKGSAVYEDTLHDEVNVATRISIAFEAALDQNEGLDANAHQQAIENVTSQFLRMHPYKKRGANSGGQGMSSP